jgi:hypothetical protein
MLISDFSHTRFDFGNGKTCTIFEGMMTRSQMDGRKDFSCFDPHDHLSVLHRLAQENRIVPDTGTFMELIAGKAPSDAYETRMVQLFEAWKTHGAPRELEIGQYFYDLLAIKRKYVTIMYPFYGAFCSYKHKAQQLLALRGFWGDRRNVFFMLAYKFSAQTRVMLPNDAPIDMTMRKREKRDKHYVVYEQAANALWDFLEACTGITKCSNGKVQLVRNEEVAHSRGVGEVWLDWLGRKPEYQDFLASAVKKKNEHRVSVFRYFIWLYLNDKAGLTALTKRIRFQLV